MSPRKTADFGDLVTGMAIDSDLWDRESQVRMLRPPRTVTGTVQAIYVHMPKVLGVTTSDGRSVTIKLR